MGDVTGRNDGVSCWLIGILRDLYFSLYFIFKRIEKDILFKSVGKRTNEFECT